MTTNPNVQIYDLQLSKYSSDLEEVHPSLDGCLDKPDIVPGADRVATELDVFNLKYQRLCEALRERLEEVGELNKDDPDVKVRNGNKSHFKNSTVFFCYINIEDIKYFF